MKPLFSIIVPIYNSEKYLDICIQSILSQTYTNLELLLIDDGSNDKSSVICDNIAIKDHRVRVFHIKNSGPSFARNYGLQQAKGDWIGFVDSDDEISLDMYNCFYQEIKNNDVDIIYCDFYMIKSNEKRYYSTVPLFDDKTTFLQHYMVKGWTSLWNMLIKKTLFDNYSIALPETIRYCEDFHTAVRLIYYANKIIKVDKALYYYNRVNEYSLLHKGNSNAYEQERSGYLEIMNFFEERNCLQMYEKQLSWKILRTEQEWVLNVSDNSRFISENTFTHRYILNCPFLNVKMKLMMWFLVHKMGYITRSFLFFRNMFR